MLQFCHSNGIHVTAHSPLGGKPVAQVAPNAHLPGPMNDSIVSFQLVGLCENAKFAISKISKIAAEYNVSAATILLAWALRRGTSAVPKSFSSKNISSNLIEIQDFRLHDHDLNAIEALRDDDNGIRFNDPANHWGFDIYSEVKDEPAREDVKSINRRVGVPL